MKNTEWIKQYVTYMLASDFEKGLTLKEINFPTSLFKYRPLNDYTLENLEYKTLWLADVNSLNDPFECFLLLDNNESLRHFFSDKSVLEMIKAKFGIEISNKELNEIIKSEKPYEAYSRFCFEKGIVLNVNNKEQEELILKRWTEIIEKEKTHIRICSFSELNDSLLMWSHYANQHQGICIEYDFQNESKPFLQPVYYSHNRFKIGTMEELNLLNQLIASIIKYKDWEYEREWRLTIGPQDNVTNDTINAPTPTAIYLGTRFNLNNKYKRLQLKRICKEQNIPVYQMKMDSSDYKIIKGIKISE